MAGLRRGCLLALPFPLVFAACSGDASDDAGEYCGGDKVDDADARTLHQCDGPGPAKVVSVCAHGCFVATGQDDFCRATIAACAKASLLTYGLAPDASDHLRCSGLDAGDISQTIGDAAASAGTHAQDGTIGGKAYCAATDLRVAREEARHPGALREERLSDAHQAGLRTCA
jgi:hypothetical protein